jgi:hypothetical protein
MARDTVDGLPAIKWGAAPHPILHTHRNPVDLSPLQSRWAQLSEDGGEGLHVEEDLYKGAG